MIVVTNSAADHSSLIDVYYSDFDIGSSGKTVLIKNMSQYCMRVNSSGLCCWEYGLPPTSPDCVIAPLDSILLGCVAVGGILHKVVLGRFYH